jgi:multidrug efflux system membrane fusion protein
MNDVAAQPPHIAVARRRWPLALAAAALVAAGAWALRPRAPEAPAGGPAGAAARPVPVVAEAARTGDVRVYLDGIGSVTPLATVTVRTRVDGELMTVAFREGQEVHAGDVLAEIDPRPFEVQLTQAQGTLTRDQALLENARRDLVRYQLLVKQDSIAKQQRDTQEALVHQYEGALETDRGQVDDARLQLTYCRITAPIGGRLGLRLVDPGNMVHASDAGGLVVITQMQPMGVVFTLPEDSLPPLREKLRAGASLAVEAWDREQAHKLATGSLLTIDNEIDQSTGTVRIKAEFPNDDEGLFPNQFVNAKLLLDVEQGATMVPTVAVQRGSQGPFVYVVRDDHTIEVRPVQLGATDGDDTAIHGGVAPQESVVIDGTDRLRQGVAVAPGPRRQAAPAKDRS